MSAAAGRRIAVPDGVDWRRMHPVSPLLEGWKVVTAVIAVLTVRNVDNLVEAYRCMPRLTGSISPTASCAGS